MEMVLVDNFLFLNSVGVFVLGDFYQVQRKV